MKNSSEKFEKLTGATLAFLTSISIENAIAEENIFPEVVVREKSQRDESYKTTKTTIGKFSQSAKDIPQSLTIVNQNLISDRAAYSFQDALRNVAGLTFNAGEGGRVGDNITIRGFGASSDLYLDGVRDNAQYNRDTFNIEQIEVLRGASSMLFGRGSTGGVVNQVQKEPKLNANSVVSFTAGSHDFYRETADVNKEIGDNSAIRINLMKSDNKSNRDVVSHDGLGLAASAKFGIDTENEYLLSYTHLQYEDKPDFGIPIPNAQNAKPISVPNDNYYGAWSDFQKDKSDILTANWTHKIDENNQVKTILRKTMVQRDYQSSAPRVVNSSTIGRGNQGRYAEEENNIVQTNLNSKFNLLKMNHELLLGAEFLYEKAARFSYSSSTKPNVNALTPNTYAPYSPNFNRINPQHYSDTNLGLYFQDIIEFVPNWKLLLGGRYDDFSAEYQSSTTSTGAVSKYERTDRVFSYRSGLMYQPNDDSTYYLSYGTSFNPSGDLYSVEATTSDKSAKTAPEKSINTEIGAKWELLKKKLFFRTALFRSEKTNERNSDPALADTYLLSGKRHTDGVEFEINGRATQRWEVFGGVAFMRSEIDKHVNQNAVGLRSVNTPTVSGNLWNTFKINQQWKFGLGADFVGERLGYSVSTTDVNAVPVIRRIPGYTRFDAMLQWDNKQYSVKLNVFNLLDKEYFNSIYINGGFGVPGIDRSAQLTVSYKF